MSKVITGKVRAAELHIFEPVCFAGVNPEYSCAFIIPKSDIENVSAINKAIDDARQEGILMWGGSIPSNLYIPLRDGDLSIFYDPDYEGCYYIYATSIERPRVLDFRRKPITDHSMLYSGCYVRASITFYPFSIVKYYGGIGAKLNSIQFLDYGEMIDDNKFLDY